MAVMTDPVTRRDWLLHRGADETWAWRLLKDVGDGNRPTGMDVRSWTATLELSLPDGTSVYTRGADRMTSDGFVWFDIPYTAFAADVWAARPTGTYKVTATTDTGDRILIGDGHWALA